MLSFLLGLIPGALNTVNGITNAISNERIALLNAKTDQERIASEEKIATLQAQRDVLVEDAKHSNFDIWIRGAFTAGPIFVLNKIFIWDKAFDGTTLLSDQLWNVIYIVIGFYFVHSTAALFRK